MAKNVHFLLQWWGQKPGKAQKKIEFRLPCFLFLQFFLQFTPPPPLAPHKKKSCEGAKYISCPQIILSIAPPPLLWRPWLALHSNRARFCRYFNVMQMLFVCSTLPQGRHHAFRSGAGGGQKLRNRSKNWCQNVLSCNTVNNYDLFLKISLPRSSTS